MYFEEINNLMSQVEAWDHHRTLLSSTMYIRSIKSKRVKKDSILIFKGRIKAYSKYLDLLTIENFTGTKISIPRHS